MHLITEKLLNEIRSVRKNDGGVVAEIACVRNRGVEYTSTFVGLSKQQTNDDELSGTLSDVKEIRSLWTIGS